MKILFAVLCLTHIGFSEAFTCYNINVGDFYCAEPCSGYIRNHFCTYDTYTYSLYNYFYNYYDYYYYKDNNYKIGSLSMGTFVGVVVGSIVGVVFIFLFITSVFTACTKSAETIGRVVHPVNQHAAIALVQSPTDTCNNLQSGPSHRHCTLNYYPILPSIEVQPPQPTNLAESTSQYVNHKMMPLEETITKEGN